MAFRFVRDILCYIYVTCAKIVKSFFGCLFIIPKMSCILVWILEK